MHGADAALELAYWFLRLNGFLTATNFLLHPIRRGGLRTDADLVGVRLPIRQEYEMRDYHRFEGTEYIEWVIAEVKTGGPCRLNGPWTDRSKQNIQHLLMALGACPRELIDSVADGLYAHGSVRTTSPPTRYSLLAFAADPSETLASDVPEAMQLPWAEVLGFIQGRFVEHKNQKKNHESWPTYARHLYQMAVRLSAEEFVAAADPSRGATSGIVSRT